MTHGTHYPHHDTARSRAYDAGIYDGRDEGVDSGIYLVIAGMLLLIAALAFSGLSHDEIAGTRGGLVLTQPER
jgi:hypothetical protein